MSSKNWDELIEIPENENIMFSDNAVMIHPEARLYNTFIGTLIITDKRIIALHNKEKGLINKTFDGYDKLEYDVNYSEMNRIEVAQTSKNALKIWTKTDRGADEKPFFGLSVKDSTIFEQICDAISIQKPIKNRARSRMSDDLLLEKIGYNGTIRVYTDYVEIDRTDNQGLSALVSIVSGLHGVKRLYFKDIGSIHFKKQGLAVGWIQFSILGGKDTSGIFKTVENENTITFQKNNREWEQLYHYIKDLLDKFKKDDEPKLEMSITDELEKAAQLFNNSLISKEEFNKLKAKILS